MLLKGKRTFESLMNSLAHHLAAADGNWEPDEAADEPTVVFGEGEWLGVLVLDGKENVYGVELENSTYTDVELMVVEKALALLEGISWSEETRAPAAPKRRRKREVAVVVNGHTEETDESEDE